MGINSPVTFIVIVLLVLTVCICGFFSAAAMFESKTANNLGDAKGWERQLKLATDKYYDLLSTNSVDLKEETS